MSGQQGLLLENAETFLGERILGQPITVIQCGLCGPTHAECGLHVPSTPIEEATQCRPIANRFERKLLKWGTGDDQSVQIRRFTVEIQHFVVRFDVLLRCGLVSLTGHAEQNEA